MSQIVKTGDLIAIMFGPRSYETMRDGRVGVTSATRKSHLLIGCKLHQFVRAAELFDAISSTSLIGIGRDVRSRRGGKMAAGICGMKLRAAQSLRAMSLRSLITCS